MNKHYLLILFIFVLQGCSSLQFHEEHYASRYSQFGYGFKPKESQSEGTEPMFSSSKIIKKYADRIAFDLREQVDITLIPAVSIASFVDLDDNLTHTHALGNKLAEALIVSFKEAGFYVIELNLANDIEINNSGSFIFKRNQKNTNFPPFIVSAIMNYDQSGININSRLIQTKDAAVFAAHSMYMPYAVVKSTFPNVEGTDLIIKGS